MSWQIEGSLNSRDRVSKAKDNLTFLQANHDKLTGTEIIRIEAIANNTIWKLAAFYYLEQKRQKYDVEYAEIKHLETKVNQTAKAIRDYEADKALEQLKHDENLIETNAKLIDEIYWLRTELSGLKQTLAISQRASKR